ncbi:MAG: hypothetical protein IT331_07465 [Anaerolineae bacterium]|nr:hypothetical protein [Anaerolineae bacterium]
MEFVLMLHSLWRWVVVVVALVALVKFGWGWLRKKSPDTLDGRLRLGFVSVLDVQALLGVVLLVLYAINNVPLRVALEHAVIMVVAVVLAHLTSRWGKRDDNTALRNNSLIVLAVIVLIVVGVARVMGEAA